MLLFNGDYTLSSIGHLHTVINTPHGFFRLFHNLLHVMLQQRFTLRCIHQNISALQVDIQLHSCGESCTAHSHNSCGFNQIKSILALNLYVIITLFLGSLDDDRLLGNFFYHTIHTGMHIGAKFLRCGKQASSFNGIPYFYDRCSRCTDVLSE